MAWHELLPKQTFNINAQQFVHVESPKNSIYSKRGLVGDKKIFVYLNISTEVINTKKQTNVRAKLWIGHRKQENRFAEASDEKKKLEYPRLFIYLFEPLIFGVFWRTYFTWRPVNFSSNHCVNKIE